LVLGLKPPPQVYDREIIGNCFLGMFVVQNEHIYQRKLRTFDFFVDLSLRFLSKILHYSKKNVHYRALMADEVVCSTTYGKSSLADK
jgi:hypothetical protein